MVRLFSDVASRVADPYLSRAVALAERARGMTSPNPLVGCVVVRDGEIVGEGYHPRAGEPHAEVFALGAARDRAREADVYVTLEPCAHHGRTPPCVDALIAAGVKRVVVGMPDPNKEAAGGADRLRAAGIEVEFAADASPFEELNEGWLHRLQTGRPLVVAKVGMSLDARVALERGQRANMTGASGSAVTMRLRARADAVAVGAMTVIADDPSLTLRDAHGAPAEHQPLRVVLARGFVPGPDAKVFNDLIAPTLVIAPSGRHDEQLAVLPSHVLVERYDEGEGFSRALELLGERGVGELLIEPGPRLLTSLLADDAVDVLVTVTAGGMAGDSAPSLYHGPAERHAEALTHGWVPVEAGIEGDVSVVTWRRTGAGLSG